MNDYKLCAAWGCLRDPDSGSEFCSVDHGYLQYDETVSRARGAVSARRVPHAELKHIMPCARRGYLNYADDVATGAAKAWAETLLPYEELSVAEQDIKPEVWAARQRWDAILSAIESYEKGEGY